MTNWNWTVKALLGSAVAALLLTTTAAFAGEVQYERQGRFMKRVVHLDSQAPAAQPASAKSQRDTRVIYDKGDLGKYERQGRFLKRIDIGGQRGIESRGIEFDKRGVRHIHGIDGKSHRNVGN